MTILNLLLFKFLGFILQRIQCSQEANFLLECLESSKIIEQKYLSNFLMCYDNWLELLKEELSKDFYTDIVHLATCIEGEENIPLKGVLDSMKQCDNSSEVRRQNTYVIELCHFLHTQCSKLLLSFFNARINLFHKMDVHTGKRIL